MSEPALSTGRDETAVSPAPSSPSPAPASQFGRYRMVRQLGAGGMGTVYLAHDTLLDRPVALKLPHPEAVASESLAERFYREARAAARLDHPGICRVYDVGECDGRPYLTMAFIEGAPLAAAVRDFPGRPREAAEILREVARAVAAAHAAGVVHRDLKPANVIVDSGGRPVVMDFGLARLRAQPVADAGETRPGVVLGTPAYMAPEQATGDLEAVGPASDVYSLGVILYELLTGRRPFEGELIRLLVQVASETSPAPSAHRPDVDPVLEAICLKALAKRPGDRFPSAAEFAAALDDFLAGRGAAELGLGPASPTQRAADAVLRAFRSGGWELGCQRVESCLARVEGLSESASTRLRAWLAGEPGAEAGVAADFADVAQLPALAAWQRVGRAYAQLRSHRLDDAWAAADEAARALGQADPALEAELAHLRGAVTARRGKWDEAERWLDQAVERVGGDHPLAVPVLTALGRVLAGKCHYAAACEFLRQAAYRAEENGDVPAQLIAAEELGKAHIDWDRLDAAEEVLNAAWKLVQRRRDPVAEARLVHQLGRVVLRRGELAADSGKKATADKRLAQAADYFAFSARAFAAAGRPLAEGRALRDAARVCLATGDLEGAAGRLNRAETLVAAAEHAEGMAEVARTQARLALAGGRSCDEPVGLMHAAPSAAARADASRGAEEAVTLLLQARAAYEGSGRRLEAARTQLELAHALAASDVPRRMVVLAYQDAVGRAEECRHDGLVRAADQELESLDEEAYWRLSFERVRNTAAQLFPSGLADGVGEVVSVVCLEFAGFDSFCRGQEPDSVLQTLNQLMAEFEAVVGRLDGHITSYHAGGIVALVREANHAERAVQAALDLRAAAAEFNRARGPLGLALLPARVGVATGPAFLGNLGTYRYLCFTPVGPVVNLAGALARQADPAWPCISQETYEQVRDRFAYRPEGPREVEARGLPRVWEVVERCRPLSKTGRHPR